MEKTMSTINVQELIQKFVSEPLNAEELKQLQQLLKEDQASQQLLDDLLFTLSVIQQKQLQSLLKGLDLDRQKISQEERESLQKILKKSENTPSENK